jgi:hypothetical protein
MGLHRKRSIRSKSSNRSKRFERLKRLERFEPRLSLLLAQGPVGLTAKFGLNPTKRIFPTAKILPATGVL